MNDTINVLEFANARLVPQIVGDGAIQFCPACGGANVPNKRIPLQACMHCRAVVSWAGPLWGEVLK